MTEHYIVFLWLNLIFHEKCVYLLQLPQEELLEFQSLLCDFPCDLMLCLHLFIAEIICNFIPLLLEIFHKNNLNKCYIHQTSKSWKPKNMICKSTRTRWSHSWVFLYLKKIERPSQYYLNYPRPLMKAAEYQSTKMIAQKKKKKAWISFTYENKGKF